MSRTYTEEEVTMAINITAMIANHVGSPASMGAFLMEKVPEELHSRILSACFGCKIFGGGMSAMFNPMMGSIMGSLMEKLSKAKESEEDSKPQKPKDISDMTPDELNAYIDQKLKEKREGK